ncbi:MAG TPA: hypothetical protein VHX60_16290 [Acidobacteriaceae bacterium]|jgi:hypothetical protein|nr:hypothetical protein [Acidobacteriaceae bacterium]
MRIRFLLASLGACAVLGVQGQSLPQQPAGASAWQLPHGLEVKDAGPRTYRFTVVYNTANTTGQIVQRQRVTGDYTRGLPNGDVMWKNVGLATAMGATAPFPLPQSQDYMEGFRYRDDLDATMQPDFFKSFPATAVLERNLVWDTGMFEMFGQKDFDLLQLNQPLHAGANQDVKMPNVGTFHNRDIVLEWVGRSQRNGEDCALIDYQAFFNPLEIASGGMTLNGRSDYWGEIWVSLTTKQIEYATINEEVFGEMTLPGQKTPQNLSVFRTGELALVSGKN